MGKFILLDERQANQVYKSNKDNLNNKPSVIEETKISKEETITEGLKFFKASNRLNKLSDKLAAKSRKPNLTDEEKKSIIDMSKKLRKLSEKFERAEDLYDIGKKAQARTMEKDLKKTYFDTLKVLRKSENVDLLKKVGGFAIMLSSMVIPYVLLNKFFPTLSFGNTNAAAFKETNPMKQAGLYLKRAGAFAICGIPTKTASKIINTGLDMQDEKIMQTIDKNLDLD